MGVITDERRGFVAPERTVEQRLDALVEANRIRSHRARLKVDLHRGRAAATDAFYDADCDTMKVFDLLLHVPKVGRVKAAKLLKQAGVSPTKTIGGVTDRQRGELLALLGGVA